GVPCDEILGNHSKGLPGCFYTLWAEACQGMDAAHLATLASEAKRQAKALPGYSLHLIEAA
ncbi:hypothetical protein, partial [Pseudomonas aeruginosa]|uniref:hypothetical protein n=1 Tax=Pseudomonas aeruginosa TaxID=287 RepID=UPI00196934FE